MSRVVGVCVLRRVKQVVDASLIRRLSNGLDRDVLRRDHRRAIGIGERKVHRCGTLAMARDQTVLIDGQDCLVGRSPRSRTVRICRIGHSRQLKRGELSYRVSTRNRNTRGRRGGDNVNCVVNSLSRFAVPRCNRIRDNRIAHNDTSYSRG